MPLRQVFLPVKSSTHRVVTDVIENFCQNDFRLDLPGRLVRLCFVYRAIRAPIAMIRRSYARSLASLIQVAANREYLRCIVKAHDTLENDLPMALYAIE